MADDVATPNRDWRNEDFIRSPFRWFSNECQNIQLTSPLVQNSKKGSRLCLNEELIHETSDFGGLEFSVATPSPPTPFSLLRSSRGRSQDISPLASSMHKSPIVLKLFGLCECPPSICEALSRLGWVGEQVLCVPLEQISHVLKKLESRCREVEWKQLLRLRDAFLQCAVSHLEASFLIHTFTSYSLPASVNSLFHHFLQVAESICQRLPKCAAVEENTSSFSSSFQEKIRLSPFPDATALLSPVLSLSQQLVHCEKIVQSTPKKNGDSLLNRLVNLVRKQSISRLGQVLSQPIEESDEHGQNPTTYSSPVVRRAQKRLGDMWRLVEEFGVGEQLHHAVAHRLCSLKRSSRRDFLEQNNSLAFRLSLKKKEEKNGSLALMGPRCVRKGRYVSRKNIQAKSKRTREWNKKRRESISQKGFKEYSNSPMLLSTSFLTGESLQL